MTPIRIVAVGLLAGAVGIGSLAATPPASTPAAPATPGDRAFPGTHAFVNVHVVPMDQLRVLEHQTVLVRDGTIEAVGDTGSVEVPDDARRIEGRGRYLVPGLGDMHVRLPGSEASDEEIEELLFLYLAHGVTTVRQATGRPGHRSLKSRLLRDRLLGPTLYVASPPLELDRVREAPDSVAPEVMDDVVERVGAEGWDLLRVPEGMSVREWEWMTQALAGSGLGFGGPVPDSVGLPRALADGASTVDDLDGLLEAVVDDRTARRIRSAYAPAEEPSDAPVAASGADDDAPRPDASGAPDPPLPLDSLARAVERRKVWAVAGRARASGTWFVPTLHRWEMRHRADDVDALAAFPELRWVSPDLRDAWRRDAEDPRATPPLERETLDELLAVRREAATALNDLNAGLLVGTGSPARFTVPGASLHREMQRLEAAGIHPYEVLLAATRSVARYATSETRESGRFGTIAPGNRADLLLVEDNPLEGLEALEQRAGVMVRGRWLPADEIEGRLQEIAERHR